MKTKSWLLYSYALSACLAIAQNPAVTVQIDANAGRHPIDPRIYGVSYGDAQNLVDLN